MLINQWIKRTAVASSIACSPFPHPAHATLHALIEINVKSKADAATVKPATHSSENHLDRFQHGRMSFAVAQAGDFYHRRCLLVEDVQTKVPEESREYRCQDPGGARERLCAAGNQCFLGSALLLCQAGTWFALTRYHVQ